MNSQTLDSIASHSLTLIETMVSEGNAALTSSDPEHMHAFRVAVRKFRVVLKVLPPSGISQSDLRHFRKFMATAGAVSNRLRDFDVIVEHLSGRGREVLELYPFLRWIGKRRSRQMALFLLFVGSAGFTACLSVWKQRVVSGEYQWQLGSLESASATILRIFRKRCRKNWRQAGLEAWHVFRKEVKAIRYLVSIPGYVPFVGIEADKQKELLELLVETQIMLGVGNDLSVRLAMVKEYLANPKHHEKALRTTRKMLRSLYTSDRLELEKSVRHACAAVERLNKWSGWPILERVFRIDSSIKGDDDEDGSLL